VTTLITAAKGTIGRAVGVGSLPHCLTHGAPLRAPRARELR